MNVGVAEWFQFRTQNAIASGKVGEKNEEHCRVVKIRTQSGILSDKVGEMTLPCLKTNDAMSALIRWF